MALSTQPVPPRQPVTGPRVRRRLEPPTNAETWRPNTPTTGNTPAAGNTWRPPSSPTTGNTPSAAETWRPAGTAPKPGGYATNADYGWNQQQVWRSLSGEQQKAAGGWGGFFQPGQNNQPSWYQTWLRTRQGSPIAYGTGTGAKYVPAQNGGNGYFDPMNPMDEAQMQAKLMDDARKAGLDRYVSGMQAQLSANLDPAYDAVKQQMADQGILSSTGYGTKLGQTYNQLAAPIMNQIGAATEEYQTWRNNLGDQTAALLQQLMRQGRDEGRADRAFNTASSQWQQQFNQQGQQFDKDYLARIYEMLYAGSLGRGQVQQDFNGIDFPGVPKTWTNMLAGLKGDPGYASGPQGDAGEKPGTRPGTVQYKLKSYARERAGVEDAFNERKLRMAEDDAERQAKIQAFQQAATVAEMQSKGFGYDPATGQFTATGGAGDAKRAEFIDLIVQNTTQRKVFNPNTGAYEANPNMLSPDDLVAIGKSAFGIDVMSDPTLMKLLGISAPSDTPASLPALGTKGAPITSHANSYQAPQTFNWATGEGLDNSGGPLQQLAKWGARTGAKKRKQLGEFWDALW